MCFFFQRCVSRRGEKETHVNAAVGKTSRKGVSSVLLWETGTGPRGVIAVAVVLDARVRVGAGYEGEGSLPETGGFCVDSGCDVGWGREGMFGVSSKGCAVGKMGVCVWGRAGWLVSVRGEEGEEGGRWGWWGGDGVGAGDAVELATEDGGGGGGGFFGLWHDGERRRGRGSFAFVAVAHTR